MFHCALRGRRFEAFQNVPTWFYPDERTSRNAQIALAVRPLLGGHPAQTQNLL